MAVRIRMKKLGRRHRPFFRICATDTRTARDGRVIEELGHYDPMVQDADARTVLNGERIDYWLSVGASPSDKVKVLIKKYGTNGTRREQQQAALERLRAEMKRRQPLAAPPASTAEEPQEAPPAASSDAPPAQETTPTSEESAEPTPTEQEDSSEENSE